MMREVYMEQRGATGDTEHNKFFKLTDDGNKVTSFWGACGTNGQSKVLIESPDLAVRQEAWDKKFKEKTKRKDNPYVVITDTNGARTEKVEARPSSDGRRWGLEVETHTNLNKAEIVRLMRERGLEIQDGSDRYFHSTGRVWDLKRDSSCGYEFASPILSGEAGLFDAKLAVEKIRTVNDNAVNRQCGIHVTADVSDHSQADLKRLAIGYLKAQEHFYRQCAEWRQDNRYCKRNPTHNVKRMIEISNLEAVLDLCGGWRRHDDRYHGLNWTRVFNPKVVEFRMLESSVNIRQVGAWIRMCVGFIDGLKKSQVTFRTGDEFSEETFKKICTGEWKP
jgi:predicted DNA-binding WGR domain protein